MYVYSFHTSAVKSAPNLRHYASTSFFDKTNSFIGDSPYFALDVNHQDNIIVNHW